MKKQYVNEEVGKGSEQPFPRRQNMKYSGHLQAKDPTNISKWVFSS